LFQSPIGGSEALAKLTSTTALRYFPSKIPQACAGGRGGVELRRTDVDYVARGRRRGERTVGYPRGKM
jgi:hypothetical protein